MNSIKDKHNLYQVDSVSWKGHLKRIRIEPFGGFITLPLSACVSKGDSIRLVNGSAWVICKNGESQFIGPYFVREKIRLGSIQFEVLIKEITELEEHKAYISLAELHYRGHIIHGRTARLIIRTHHPAYPKVIGYIELATPFYMNKARSRILDAPFNFDSVEWQHWDMLTLRKYIHLIVRIARVVVYPEFRGIGIGQILVRHAAEFAKRRWQVAGYLPYFIEISADMLKYVPFAERAKMIFVGETEGNLHRVAKDMNYLISRFGSDNSGQTQFEEICGICDQQVARMSMSLQVMKREGLKQDELVKRLRSLSKESVLKDFALFHNIVTLPKPHYMMGLNSYADDFLKERVVQLSPKNGRVPPKITTEPIMGPIRFVDVGISYVSRVRRTQSTHAVQQAFSISPDDLRTQVIKGLNLEIDPGKIFLLIGPSGSGKTTLLNALKGKLEGRKDACLDGYISIPKNAKFGSFEPIRSQKPIVEALGAKDVHYGIYLLGLAGLSEAFLYLKRFGELSAGQQYRAMLAQLMASNSNVWLADEFCANLDPITATVVGYNIQRVARKNGATVVLAAPHANNFIFSLKPDMVVVLTNAWDHNIIPGEEYSRVISSGQGKEARFPTLRLSPEFVDAVRTGQKTTTIRIGKRQLDKGLLVLESSVGNILVRVVDVVEKMFSRLNDQDAQKDGMKNLDELRETLKKFYPRLGMRSRVTIIYFDQVCSIS
jgi:ABC-type ATPase with predicted acetyltransferase domain/uncharacterized protein YqfB (UPF0267 family)